VIRCTCSGKNDHSQQLWIELTSPDRSDIIALIVALYAIRIFKSPETDLLTYGWKRAEILAAFFNGIFLVALSVSIIIHAIQRFIHIEGALTIIIDVARLARDGLFLTADSAEVSEPLLVIIIGCVGLATNVAGIFIFHGK
jgi:zinc transporter 1